MPLPKQLTMRSKIHKRYQVIFFCDSVHEKKITTDMQLSSSRPLSPLQLMIRILSRYRAPDLP